MCFFNFFKSLASLFTRSWRASKLYIWKGPSTRYALPDLVTNQIPRFSWGVSVWNERVISCITYEIWNKTDQHLDFLNVYRVLCGHTIVPYTKFDVPIVSSVASIVIRYTGDIDDGLTAFRKWLFQLRQAMKHDDQSKIKGRNVCRL